MPTFVDMNGSAGRRFCELNPPAAMVSQSGPSIAMWGT